MIFSLILQCCKFHKWKLMQGFHNLFLIIHEFPASFHEILFQKLEFSKFLRFIGILRLDFNYFPLVLIEHLKIFMKKMNSLKTRQNPRKILEKATQETQNLQKTRKLPSKKSIKNRESKSFTAKFPSLMIRNKIQKQRNA